MSIPAARALASVAACAACAVIGWAAPGYAGLALICILTSMAVIWKAGY